MRLIALARLLRLPNVFTAIADILLAACAGSLFHDLPALALLCAASACLYLSGMVWNDVFDRAEDAVARPFRPLPSGAIRLRTAVLVGSGLMASGLMFAAGARPMNASLGLADPLSVALALAACILLYDGGLKRTLLGPLGMGACRALNVLLGLAPAAEGVSEEVHWLLPTVTGVYVVGVTGFARREEGLSSRVALGAWAGVIVASWVLALVLRRYTPPEATAWFPYLLVGYGAWVGGGMAEAIRRPDPARVQGAVKRLVLGLIVYDAILASAFVGLAGLLIVLLLPPALWLGKWVYST